MKRAMRPTMTSTCDLEVTTTHRPGRGDWTHRRELRSPHRTRSALITYCSLSVATMKHKCAFAAW